LPSDPILDHIIAGIAFGKFEEYLGNPAIDIE
jgi:hypothetical protein